MSRSKSWYVLLYFDPKSLFSGYYFYRCLILGHYFFALKVAHGSLNSDMDGPSFVLRHLRGEEGRILIKREKHWSGRKRDEFDLLRKEWNLNKVKRE